jgi:hypothetical protein
MNEWRTPIRCYVSMAGNNKIREWYEGLSVRERADVDELLTRVRQIPLPKWSMPLYKPLIGLGELRWSSEKKQHRLLGFPKDGTWYAVIGCFHKDQRYYPANALETAKDRKKQIENDQVKTVDYDF